MGCHTWYKVPVVKGEEEVKKELRANLERWRKASWWDAECEAEVPKRLQAIETLDPEWLDGGSDYYFYVVNGVPGLYRRYEGDSDEPRIGGYPDTIITSADQMFAFMRSGFYSDYYKKHFYFAPDGDRTERVRELITTFFQKHPDGIITFG
jgi:hypothetical protein